MILRLCLSLLLALATPLAAVAGAGVGAGPGLHSAGDAAPHAGAHPAGTDPSMATPGHTPDAQPPACHGHGDAQAGSHDGHGTADAASDPGASPLAQDASPAKGTDGPEHVHCEQCGACASACAMACAGTGAPASDTGLDALPACAAGHSSLAPQALPSHNLPRLRPPIPLSA